MTSIAALNAPHFNKKTARPNVAELSFSAQRYQAGTLEFDTFNMTPKAIGEEQGIHTTELFTKHQKQIETIVNDLWKKKTDPQASLGWLGFDNQHETVRNIQDFANNNKDKFDDLIILGIGGSALGARAMFEALLPANWNQLSKTQRNGFPKYHILDNIDPDHLSEVLAPINLKKSLINVVSKSGSTAEPMAQFLVLKEKLQNTVGKENINKHLVFTTDPKEGVLRPIANEEKIPAFPIPPNAGGRFSIFSSVGLLPAAMLGICVKDLLDGVAMMNQSLQQTDIFKNPAAQAALLEYQGIKKGKNISVLMPYSTKLGATSDWYVQLWAESLGKAKDNSGKTVHTGQTPIKAVGATDQHSQMQLFNAGPFDKIINFIRIKTFQYKIPIPKLYPNKPELSYLGGQTIASLMHSEFEGARASLNAHNRPNTTLTLPKLDAFHYGELLQFLMFKTAIAAKLLNINGFDQPNVELGKQFTYSIMGRPGYEKQLNQFKKHSQ